MKSILISIKPEWCDLITLSKKTVEVRKTRPKIETPFKVYIYCSGKNYDKTFYIDKFMHKVFLNGNGKQKVIGEFVCDGIIEIGNYQEADYSYMLWVKDRETTERLCKDACLNEFAIQDYLGQNGGFGWRISNLVIYDEPKELSEFNKTLCTKNTDCYLCDRYDHIRKDCNSTITRPPQSWCYVEEKE